MTMNSMTGFARSTGSCDSANWHWEIKSVNGKGLDTRIRLPQGFDQIEPQIRYMCGQKLNRGNLQISLQLDNTLTSTNLRLNQAVLSQVLEISQQIQEKIGGHLPHIDSLLSVRGVIETEDVQMSESESHKLHENVLADFANAISALCEARAREGKKISTVIASQIDTIEKLTNEARDCPARSVTAIKQRLADNIAKVMENSSSFDSDRLHQEAMIMASKADIQEELDRLYAHISAARELIVDNDAIGRRFDFLAQEFNREANTLCSKANDPAISRIGMELKTIIDQLREQVQNIE